jgi:hypothetical protein
MSTRKWTLKYGGAAILIAIAIIAAATFTNPIITPTETPTPSFTFLVMLTDPPTVPAGTTMLNLTYADVSLHVTYPNETTEWLLVEASGTVNLFTLVNMSQTIASTTLPNGTTVDKILFTISSVKAEVDGTIYNVTALSSQLTISIANSQKVNQTLGVLFDLQPTLVQIKATNSTGGTVNYFVLVPSATATVVTNVTPDHIKVGTIVKIGENDRVKLIRLMQETPKKIVISDALISVKGNVTNFSVTLTNNGSTNATIFGLTLNGQFNVSSMFMQNNPSDEGFGGRKNKEIEHPEAIPFRINGTSLVPLLGFYADEREGIGRVSSLTIQPGQSVTLSFSGVIQLGLGQRQILGQEHNAPYEHFMQSTIITPLPNETYTIRLMGEGFQTFKVTATAS